MAGFNSDLRMIRVDNEYLLCMDNLGNVLAKVFVREIKITREEIKIIGYQLRVDATTKFYKFSWKQYSCEFTVTVYPSSVFFPTVTICVESG